MDWWPAYADICGGLVIAFVALLPFRYFIASGAMRMLAEKKGWDEFFLGVIGLFFPFLSLIFVFIYSDITGIKWNQ